jgi:hypothetical protein
LLSENIRFRGLHQQKIGLTEETAHSRRLYACFDISRKDGSRADGDINDKTDVD